MKLSKRTLVSKNTAKVRKIFELTMKSPKTLILFYKKSTHLTFVYRKNAFSAHFNDFVHCHIFK